MYVCLIRNHAMFSNQNWQKFLISPILAFFLVVGLYGTAAMQAYCTLTLMSSVPETLHTKRRERHLLA
jgi:hypothetical protein